MDQRIKHIQEEAEYYREELVGRRYRHLKGDIYIVSEIAIDWENLGLIVIYKDWENPSLAWTRPLKEFISSVEIFLN